VIGLQLARQLKEAGLTWKPAAGDGFVIPDRDMDDQVFFLADMTIEIYQVPDGRVIGFNGTTEWALDDVEVEEALWLPREDQLRELLGGTFQALRRGPAGYEVETTLLGEDRTFAAESPELAYATALLHLLAASAG
jgi:hypothetical protein